MIKLLDCTLRDGGYVNKWNFGQPVLEDILEKMMRTNVDIIEAGFIRDVAYNPDMAVFSDLSQLDEIIRTTGGNKGAYQLAVMAEIANPIPVEMIADASETNCDIIRVIVWKTKHNDAGEEVNILQDGLEYCKAIAQKGYKVCVQPNRTDQYTDEEFINMLKMFASIEPYAIYVVDSWGTMYSNKVIHYMELADKTLPKNIRIGFHGHNNMMQAFSNAEKIIGYHFDREIILDASVDGIGRGAGNLNLELIARYLNSEMGTAYNIDPMCEIFDTYIKPLRSKYRWGSSQAFSLSAKYNVNPNYAADYEEKMSLLEMAKAYSKMSENDRVIYSSKSSDYYLKMIKG